MSLPTASRKKDVFEKLEYAQEKRHELLEKLNEAEDGKHEFRFISQDAASILSTAREVFDYLANDIVDHHVIPVTSDAALKKRHADGKLKVYFPFYPKQLGPNELWGKVSAIIPAIFGDLSKFVTTLEKDEFLPQTRINGGTFTDLNRMVNEKKHDKLLSVDKEEGRIAKFNTPNVQMKFDVAEMKDFTRIVVGPNEIQIVPRTPLLYVERPKNTEFQVVGEASKSRGRLYYFEGNKQEVGKFCAYLLSGTTLVMRDFYTKYFAAD
ncbi:hypothetical protein EJD96_15880 [Herbaspirillum seropedicae]|uniref:hypothetical protein n=1 Tax=Herbaspirillum seropedicae TaxID=964 RepID=UPI0011209164|nr:hypothetical protein [Herbaspirillum seropedicae]QDD65532.1 hypothetical protein EJD96_15880 [Herbaspirillum seropedicae]